MLARLPIADHALRTAFAGLEDEPALLLAVSGGPDSMALMLAAARWVHLLGVPPRLFVATVDHGLRDGSRQEALIVARESERLELAHDLLVWEGAKPATRIQERARAARYELLVDCARARGATHILTAHHADDQAETVLMRLGRGSGVEGLAGMRRSVALAPGVALTRPLLAVSKSDLVAWCAAADLATVLDPSNEDPAYARVRLRRKRREAAELGLDRGALLRLAERMARAEQVIAAEAERLEAAVPVEAREGAVVVDCAGLRGLPLELLVRLLPRWIACAGDGPPRAPRLEQIERIATALSEALAAGGMHRATLAGRNLRLDAAGRLTLTREAPRRTALRIRDADRECVIKATGCGVHASLGI